MTWPASSRQSRGYGAAWDRLRLRILKRDQYLCQCPDCEGGKKRVTPATEVDHRISKANWQRRHGTLLGCDAPSNLQAINKDCHKRKTEHEQGKTPRPTVALDGWGRTP